MACGRRPAAAKRRVEEGGEREQCGCPAKNAEDLRCDHRLPPCSWARFSSAESRSYSSSEIGPPCMSRSAAAAEPGELLKKVRTSCFEAERLASAGVAAGK